MTKHISVAGIVRDIQVGTSVMHERYYRIKLREKRSLPAVRPASYTMYTVYAFGELTDDLYGTLAVGDALLIEGDYEIKKFKHGFMHHVLATHVDRHIDIEDYLPKLHAVPARTIPRRTVPARNA